MDNSARPCFLRALIAVALVLLVPAEAPTKASEPLPLAHDQSNPSAPTGLLDDQPEPFVPLHPRTSQDRQRLQILQQYVEARVLENQQRLTEAISSLEKARLEDPKSTAILKRLARLNRALGRLEKSVELSHRVIELEPDDPDSIWLIVAYTLEVKKSPESAVQFLESLLKNEKLDPKTAGAILAERLLGDLQAEFLANFEKAADSYAKVVEALNHQSASQIPAASMRRILRDDEVNSYLRFGEVFLRAERYGDAVLALRRGLISAPENSQIPRFLAEALLRDGQPDEALDMLEGYLRKQPQGREPYELLAEILHNLGRDDEITPKLEAAAEADPKNISLQFALAERYRESGQDERANTLLAELLKREGDPQVFGPLAASLLKERKTDELIKVIRDALDQPGGPQAIAAPLEAIAEDRKYADEVLAEALKAIEADPEAFNDDARKVFAYIANKSENPDRLIALDRLNVKHNPSPQSYRELVVDLFRNGHYEEAASTTRELIAKYPDEQNAMIFGLLARSLYLDGKIEPALEAAREAQKRDADDQETLFLIGFLLGRADRNQEAIDHYQAILARFPNDDEASKRARLGISAVYVGMDDYEKGAKVLEEVLEQDPDDPHVNNDLGYLYADRGQHLEKAEAMIRKALEDEPTNTAYLDSLGWVLYRQGRFEEALVPLEQAAEDRIADPTILDHLGDVYYRLQRYEEAQDAWKSAKEAASKSDPPDKRLPSIRQKLQELERLMASSPLSIEDQGEGDEGKP